MRTFQPLRPTSGRPPPSPWLAGLLPPGPGRLHIHRPGGRPLLAVRVRGEPGLGEGPRAGQQEVHLCNTCIPLLAIFYSIFLPLLSTFGCLCPLLASFGHFFLPLLVLSGHFQSFMVGFGHFLLLAAFCCFWLFPAVSGSFWLLRAASGCFWYSFRHLWPLQAHAVATHTVQEL